MSAKKTKKLKEKILKEKKTIEKYNQQIEEIKGKIRESEDAIEEAKQEIYKELFAGMNLDEVEERATISLSEPEEKKEEHTEAPDQQQISEGRWQ